jgi:hypothetical protein
MFQCPLCGKTDYEGDSKGKIDDVDIYIYTNGELEGEGED